MNSYNTQPVAPSIVLQNIVAHSINEDPRKIFGKFDNHCFRTLNADASYLEGFDITKLPSDYIDSHNLHDLVQFIGEL